MSAARSCCTTVLVLALASAIGAAALAAEKPVAPRGVAPAAPASPDATDVVFRALEDEVARAKTLSMDKLDKPYWACAYAQDTDRFEVAASFGALIGKDGGRSSTIEAQVRVGSASLDNTNFSDDFWGSGMRRGQGIPAEPDYDALRHALWLQFDDRFKKAAENIAKKRAFLQATEVKDRPADFGPAPVTSLVLPRESLLVDRDRWTRVVKRASAVFRDHPATHSCRVSMRGSLSHQYFVTTEGARHRFPEPLAMVSIQATTQAPDGMELAANWERWGRTEKDLPSEAEIVKAAQEVASRLEALAKAPLAQEDYAGPVLFTGRAASLFFLATLAEPLSRPRDDLGAPRQGRLVERVGKHIASKLVTVRDDPNQTSWKGQALLGHFPVDDDSVKPMPITLVEDGVLKTHYMSRVPTKHVQQTNGHSRNGEGAAGNVFVETRSPQSMAALTRRLLELAKEEDYDYALVVEDFDTSTGMRFGRMNEVMLPPPSAIYRLYADGRKEPVRGYTFKPTSFRVLKDIDAMGDDPTVANVDLRNQRTSAVAPSTLIKMIELQKTNA
ncbi:MAG: hypothetical protein HY901_20410, partial [Deltaproteobacteria bacterium]|nr:hypothetical protein [Deltaproteobacteria bacterium]